MTRRDLARSNIGSVRVAPRFARFFSGLFLAVLALGLILPGQLNARVSGPLAVQVTASDSAGNATPLAGVTVYLGGRHAATGADGVAVFTGLPSGAYALSVRHPGFDRVARQIEIPGGQRQPIAVQLQPTQTQEWTAQVLMDGLDLPVAGARVDLIPKDVNAVLSGPVRMVSDWEGALSAVAVPPGRYGLEIQATGFEPLRQELTIAENLETPVFHLRRLSESARLSVQVTDSGGRPLPDAEVVLAEVWPSGVPAQGRTDMRGTVAFDNLRVGPINRPDAEGRMAVSRRTLTVRAEAQGHVPAVVRASLAGEPQHVRIALTPEVGRELQEPGLDGSEPLELGVPVSFAISRIGQKYRFLVRLPEPALLKLNIAQGGPIETHLRLYDGQGQLLQESSAYAGRGNGFERAVAAGSYHVEISEWGDNNASETPLTFTASSESAVDPLEPNDSDGAASLLQPGEQMVGLIWPRGDRDVFRIQVERPGFLRIHDQGIALERHVIVRDATGKMLGERGVYNNGHVNLVVQVAPGLHFLEVREWGDNGESLTPYRMSVDLLPDDGMDDPPLGGGSVAAVRTLDIGSLVGSTILPIGDVDVFSLTVPAAGRLHLQSSGKMERQVQLFDRFGKLLAERGAYSNGLLTFSWFVDGPQTFFVAIREWGDNNWSPSAYVLSAWLEPADELDFLQRNDDIGRALPLGLGETIHGSYLPMGDRDVFAVETDFPGYLRVSAQSPLESHLRILDVDGALVAERGAYSGKTAELAPPVQAGRYFVMVGEWGDNNASVEPYTLSVALDRVEPDETWPLADDPPRRLADGEARAFSIDHRGDRDRFLFDMPVAGDVTLSVAAPLETLIRVFDDRTGERLKEWGRYAPTRFNEALSVQGPTRLRVELTEWGDNNASQEPGFIMLDTRGRSLVADLVRAQVDPLRPQRVAFQRQRTEYADAPQRCGVDLNGDGREDVRLDGEEPVSGDFPEQGLYVVEAVCSGTDGQRSRQRFWVQATGPRDRAGMLVTVNNLSEGQVVSAPLTPQAQAVSFDGLPISRVEFFLDGKSLGSDGQPPYEAAVNWPGLSGGEHALTVVARDRGGNEAKLERNFVLSDYFDLTPPNGAMLTGETVTVSWQAPTFGPARVRYRPQGGDDGDWTEITGQSARQRVVRLPGLETGVTYEFQPLGGPDPAVDPGPIRTLTRVKGLAFGRAQYAANIRRDYDQRVGVSVRNNGDEPLMVRLESGQPEDPLMLASFVGTGSEDRPFALAAGEEREFQFTISAQNVNTEEHRIPIRIVSETGLSDESEIVVHVRLPHVELEWSDLGPSPGGMGRTLRLTNLGDALTDLSVQPAKAHAVVLSPTVRHGLLPRGSRMDFVVTPRFYEGFTGVSTEIRAVGLDKTFAFPFAMHLEPGQAMHRVWLLPGIDPDDPLARTIEADLPERIDRAKAVGLDELDWQNLGTGSDTTGDGRPDRWVLIKDGIAWTGTDGDGDGIVDHAAADVDRNGMSEFAALRRGDRWQPSNLVEAWLEMTFALRGARDSYKPHDVEVVLNDVVIGVLKDMLPEGNFSFRIPPNALRFDESGLPVDNRIGLRTTHLRGGHYAVNSDFRFKFRLTATPVWTVGTSVEEARMQAVAMSGVSLTAPDLSLSAAQLEILGPAEPNAGDEMSLRFPVRNLGASAASDVAVALLRILPGGSREELARTTVPEVGLDQPTYGAMDWRIRGGLNNLALVVDPENTFDDPDLANNEALFMLTAAGDDTPPVLRILQPAAGVVQDTVVMLELEVDDDAGPVSPLVSIDRGLWTELPTTRGRLGVPLLLQPGAHTIDVRVVDGSGNEAAQTLELTIKRSLPVARLISPVDGATVGESILPVEVQVPGDVGLVAARTAGGPWHKASLLGDVARVELPLRFGAQTLDVMVADRHGAVQSLSAGITRTTQPTADERLSGPAASDQGLLWPHGHPDLEIDLFQASSGVLRRLAMNPEQEAVRLWEEARRRQVQGDYAGALTLYRDSLMLKPDPQTEDRVKRLEAYLGIRRINPVLPK